MFEPPDGTTDFEADAATAERTNEQDMEHRAAESRAAMYISDAEVDWGSDPVDDTTESPEMQELRLQERRLEELRLKAKRAALERRQAPQVIDSTGIPVDTATPDVMPPWSGKVITVQGKEVEVKQPPPAAIKYLAIFGTGDEGAARGDFQNFMHRHVSPKSIADIKRWSYAGEVTEQFYEDLIKVLVTTGSGRPTGPSSPSPRSR